MFASYVSNRMGPLGRFREAIDLYHVYTHDLRFKVARLIDRLDAVRADVERTTGLCLQGRKMLDIGPGQLFLQMAYFARDNDVIGIDLDLVPDELGIGECFRMFRQNGWMRTAKTIGRRLLRLDAGYREELAHQLRTRPVRHFRVLHMDAAKMTFPADSFDFVYSFSVFEHLADPSAVMEHITDVLRPGGVAYISLHPYTSESGCHDPRLFSGRRDGLPYWSHLRPEYAGRVRPNSYLNRLRLDEWRAMFAGQWGDVRFRSIQPRRAMLKDHMDEVRAGGELLDYDEEELLTGEFVALWQRP